MSGRGRIGSGPGADFARKQAEKRELKRVQRARDRELVRTVGGTFGPENIVGSRLRVRPKKKTASNTAEKFTKFKIPQKPKLLKVPKKASVNRLSEIEEINKRRLAKFETKLADNERKARLQAEKERQRAERQDEINARRLTRMMKQAERREKRDKKILVKDAKRQSLMSQMNSLLEAAAEQGQKILDHTVAGNYCEAKPLVVSNCRSEKTYKTLNKRLQSLDPKAIVGRKRLRRA